MAMRTAALVSTALHCAEMERQFYVEKKGWKMAYDLRVSDNTYWEKEINGKRWTLTLADAFVFELKVEEPRGCEY